MIECWFWNVESRKETYWSQVQNDKKSEKSYQNKNVPGKKVRGENRLPNWTDT